MEENPDDYTGPSAYVYNKPPDKKDKRSQPYNKPFRKFRRWPLQQLSSVAALKGLCGDELSCSCLLASERLMYYEMRKSNTFDL